jgi:hypothetical protein
MDAKTIREFAYGDKQSTDNAEDEWFWQREIAAQLAELNETLIKLVKVAQEK